MQTRDTAPLSRETKGCPRKLLALRYALLVLVASAVRWSSPQAQSYLVQGASMLPTLREGERVLVDKLTYKLREPARGEVVVFRYPADMRRKFIKRVIGVPGDVVEVRDWLVYVNGEPLHEEYILGPTYDEFGPVEVPEDTVFVLGDNRNHSEDSRHASVGLSIVASSSDGPFYLLPPAQIGLLAVPPGLR